MSEPRAIAVWDTAELLRVLRERFEELNIPRDLIDDIAGLANGHSYKILAIPPIKGLGPMSMFPLLGAAGLKVVLVEDDEALAKLRRRSDYRTRNPCGRTTLTHGQNTKALSIIAEIAKMNGKMGAIARMQKMTPAQRQRVAKNAIRSRWRKRRQAQREARRAKRQGSCQNLSTSPENSSTP